jgi:hypothetical protein
VIKTDREDATQVVGQLVVEPPGLPDMEGGRLCLVVILESSAVASYSALPRERPEPPFTPS